MENSSANVQKEIKREESPVKKKKRSFKYNHPIIFILLVIVFIICLFLASGLLSYKYGVKNSYLKTMTKIVPYPAAIVNYDFVRLNTYYEEVETLEKLVSQQGELTSDIQEKIKDDVLDKLIHDKIIMQLAKKFDVKLSAEDIENEKAKILEEIGQSREEVEAQLQQSYGWDFDTFFDKIVLISVYQEKVKEKYAEDEDVSKKAEKQAKEVLDLVKKGDESFQDLAKKYSQDTRFAEIGGEWGWVTKGILPVGVEEVAFAMEKGDVSDIIKTSQGYHIITITDKKDDGEPQVFLYDIFIEIPGFEEFLMDYVSESKVYKLVK